ncbi:MAG: cell filamentation protein Fic, partial [Gemmatimonadetes bacterium]|nr:cell filamentation protein Fic [Gemmatimonadota bacterium]
MAAFVPNPLPPTDPPLEIDEETKSLLDRAEREISRLELAGENVPSIDWFVYAFVRKEAVISSQIEGTQCTLIDLLNLEAEAGNEAAANDDMREVCNYLDAL